jgi:histidinol-phosphate phosphatase family protein
VFVDRDGVINEMVYDTTHGLLDSPREPAQVELTKYACEFLKGIRDLGFLIIVVTNQPGISKGTLSLDELGAVNERIAALLAPACWDDLRYCPHHPEYGTFCECRKPKPGMLLSAAADHGVDLSRSWMVGDGIVDVQAGNAAGCNTMLVARVKLEVVARFVALGAAAPDFVAVDLLAALRTISQRTAVLPA